MLAAKPLPQDPRGADFYHGLLAHDPALLHDQEEIAAAYAKSGLPGAQRKATQLKEREYEADREEQESGVPHGIGAVEVAFRYGLLKDSEKVLHWLNQGDFGVYGKSAPEFDFLRSDPRFQDLLRHQNLLP